VVTADRHAARPPQTPVPRRIGFTTAGLVVLVIAQIYLGALVAGLHAGLIYNTWPLIDGALVPPGLLFDQPAWRNFFENPLTVQFDHRMIAYGLIAMALFHVVDVWRTFEGRTLRIGAAVLAAVVCAQAALGIATLLMAAPLALAMLHQAMALVVLTAATLHASHAVALPALIPAPQLASGY
jgi:heme a synthase